MKTELGQFAVLSNEKGWDEYRDGIAKSLTGGAHPDEPVSTISFPEGPEFFPCLVSSMDTPSEPATDNGFCSHVIRCCFVYVEDAQKLVAVNAYMDTRLTDNLCGEPEEQVSDSDKYAPTHTAVLLLALVNELEAIGALKRDRLLTELDNVGAWLTENQSENLEEDSLSGVLQRMWEDKDAR